MPNGAEAIGGLIGHVLFRTRPGKFCVGMVLGAITTNLLIYLLRSMTFTWAEHITNTPYAREIFFHMWLVGNNLALVLASLIAMYAGCLAVSILFRGQKEQFYYVIFSMPAIGLALIMFTLGVIGGKDYPGHLRDILVLVYALYAHLPLALGLAIKFARRDSDYGKGDHVRGPEKLEGNPNQIDRKLGAIDKRQLRKEGQGIRIYKKVCIQKKKESHGTVIIGSPGTGKTQIINGMINDIRARGDKMIIYDKKGTYTQAFANEPGVKILAARDKRSIAWRLGADFLNPLDCQEAAHILIPDNPKESHPYFTESARHVLEAIMVQLDAIGNNWGWQDVWGAISKGKEGLYSFLQRTKEGRTAAEAIEGDITTSKNVYTTLISHLKPMSWLAKAWGNQGISLREWIKDPDSKILIIVGGVETDKVAAMTARLSLQVLINELLAMPDDLNRRLWLILDELGALGRHDTLIEAFTTGRSKGLCVVAGIQDIGRIESLYSHELAKSLINIFSTFVFLRCVDPATNQWASEAIGSQETADFMGETNSDNFTKSRSINVRHKPLFLASEIANFPDLTGVLKISDWPCAKVTWEIVPISQEYPRVVEADWVKEKAKLDDLPDDDNQKGTETPPDKPKPPAPPEKDNNPDKPDKPKWGMKQ